MWRLTHIFRLLSEGLLVSKHPALLALLLGIFSIAIHLPFALFDALGEQDAARLCNLAISGAYQNNLVLPGQWGLAYPLYIHTLYMLVKLEILLPNKLPAFMTGLSLIASGCFTAMFFLFFRLTTRRPGPVAVGTIVLQFVPAYFISSIYGFPTIVALGFFMTAAWLSARVALADATPTWGRILLGICAGLLFQIAVLLKVDVVTGAGLFCLPLCQLSTNLKKRAALITLIFAATVISFVVLNRYGNAISQQEETVALWRSWAEHFYSGVGTMFSSANARVVHHALGASTLLTGLCATIFLLYRREQRLVLFWIAIAALPGALFWSMMGGNSARHNLLLASLMPMVIALPLASKSTTFRRWWRGGILVMLLINYFWYMPSPSTVRPSGRLIESALSFRKNSRRLRFKARQLAHIDEKKVLAVLHGHRRPYFYYEIISTPSMKLKSLEPDRLVVITEDKTEKAYRFSSKLNGKERRKYIKEGFVVLYPNKKNGSHPPRK